MQIKLKFLNWANKIIHANIVSVFTKRDESSVHTWDGLKHRVSNGALERPNINEKIVALLLEIDGSLLIINDSISSLKNLKYNRLIYLNYSNVANHYFLFWDYFETVGLRTVLLRLYISKSNFNPQGRRNSWARSWIQ